MKPFMQAITPMGGGVGRVALPTYIVPLYPDVFKYSESKASQ